MTCRRLRGQTAVITGGASGVGRATAHRFGREGASTLILMDRNADALPGVVAEVHDATGADVFGFAGDVSIDDDCAAVIARAVELGGALDILVSNAPAHSSAPFLELGRSEWDRTIAVMLRASFVLGQEAARSMVATNTGGCLRRSQPPSHSSHPRMPATSPVRTSSSMVGSALTRTQSQRSCWRNED